MAERKKKIIAITEFEATIDIIRALHRGVQYPDIQISEN